ncbi:unnamed protein product [Lathyrus sativus]|nr:unnamed protein product [Lathyrus sativus]
MGEWQRVRRMNDRKLRSNIWDSFIAKGGSRKSGVEGIQSFYISEFPNNVRAKKLFKLFSYFGKVTEVVIPPKRNKYGKRFGFTKFADVEDGRVLAIKLDNIFVDKVKIHANIPRFSRLEKESRGKDHLVIKRTINLDRTDIGNNNLDRTDIEKKGSKEVIRGNITYAEVIFNDRNRNYRDQPK